VRWYEVRWPDPNTPIEETPQALAERVGKICAIGVSNFSADRCARFAG
jgi:aryl-alcohol dehydrogenase-like predicted oxidoreductase